MTATALVTRMDNLQRAYDNLAARVDAHWTLVNERIAQAGVKVPPGFVDDVRAFMMKYGAHELTVPENFHEPA